MKEYKLFIGFRLVGVFHSILSAKKAATSDGVYNIIGPNGYRDSWQVLNGISYSA